MKDLQNLVHKFMEREHITMKQALLQSSLGMSAKAGSISEIVRGVVYSEYPYTEERKKRNKEHLGEMLFYWIMLASTTGSNPEDIMMEYISSYIQKNKIMTDDDLKILAGRESMFDTPRTAPVMQTPGTVAQANSMQRPQASIREMLKFIKENEPRTKPISKPIPHAPQRETQEQKSPSFAAMGKHLKGRDS